MAGASPGGLRYLLRERVVTPDTQWVMEQIFKRHSTQLTRWPGLELQADTEEGLAMVGAPHGCKFHHFLAG